MTRSHKVWVIGDAAVDVVSQEAGRWQQFPGGASANVAVCISKLGGECGFIGCLGQDDSGHFLHAVLAQQGVDVTHLRMIPGTSTAVVQMANGEDGERILIPLNVITADSFVSSADLPVFQRHQWFCFSSIGLARRPSRETCLEGARCMLKAGGWVFFDVNLRELLWEDRSEISALLSESFSLATICKISADELCRLAAVSDWHHARFFLRDVGCTTSVITLGHNGAWLVTDESEHYFPPYRVDTVDTTGAGDAFVGCLLSKLAQHDTFTPALLKGAIDAANACGAISVSATGAMTALPDYMMLQRFIARGRG